MTEYSTQGTLRVASELCEFVSREAAPGTGVPPSAFWHAYETILNELAPLNRELLAKRDAIQAEIDHWHLRRRGEPLDPFAYRLFLQDIGYIVPQGEEFAANPTRVDPEIASMAGPQLVVPVINARFALNAANARWGSLYDALYGTDAIPRNEGHAAGKGYDPERGAEVIAKAADALDYIIPLAGGHHSQAEGYQLGYEGFVAKIAGRQVPLADPGQYCGRREEGAGIAYLFRHHGLHVELVVDRARPTGKSNPAGLADIVMEAALTAIQDCEDSVAAVDAADKVAVYRNWLGLMKGDLVDTFQKGDQAVTRSLGPDRSYITPDGTILVLPGRSLMLVRHVGHLMTTDAVLDADGNETPEGIMDAMVATLAAIHDLKKTSGPRNSRVGSIYVVKPKMHGPEEVAFADTLFDRVEDALGLARHTIKIGVMDEERRTSVNLREAIRAVKDRIVFINTGFLDRTGDEIHTSMCAGPMIPKDEIKSSLWLTAYEANNVYVGLSAKLDGKAQIGKGMWAKPDAMAEMLEVKVGQLNAGASTAWVPSPTASVLHSLHYHQVDVRERQSRIRQRENAALTSILTPPLLEGRNLSADEVRREVDNNCQGILGYVVRWVDQGIGCSKVPDINDIALMEDRATLRISSQHLANWLLHGLVDRPTIEDSLRRMAVAVDRQNAEDPTYEGMANDFDQSLAFKTARDLIFDGLTQPNGYTEPLLHRGRRQRKAERSVRSERPSAAQ